MMYPSRHRAARHIPFDIPLLLTVLLWFAAGTASRSDRRRVDEERIRSCLHDQGDEHPYHHNTQPTDIRLALPIMKATSPGRCLTVPPPMSRGSHLGAHQPNDPWPLHGLRRLKAPGGLQVAQSV
jgi:hypothetical protein